MDIAALINRVGSARRKFAGAYYMLAKPIHGNAIKGELELLRNDAAVYFEGAFTQPGFPVPVSMRFTVPFSGITTSGGRAILTCSEVQVFEGHILSTAHGFEFLARQGNSVCAIHLHFTGQESFVLSGMIELVSHCIAFSAEPAPEWERTAMAKVYALRRRHGGEA